MLKRIAEALLEHETIDGEDIDIVLGGGTIERRRPRRRVRRSTEPVKEKRPQHLRRARPS